MGTHHRIALRVLGEHQAIAERLRLAPRRAIDFALGNIARWSREYAPGHQPEWLIEWRQLLTGPLAALIEALTADTEQATRLRTSSPFVGLLTYEERIEILERIQPEMAISMEICRTSWDQYFPPWENRPGTAFACAAGPRDPARVKKLPG